MSEQIDQLINSFTDSFIASKELKTTLETEKNNISESQKEIQRIIQDFNHFVEEAKTTVQTAKTEALELLEEIRKIYSEEQKLKNGNSNSLEVLRKETASRFSEIEKRLDSKTFSKNINESNSENISSVNIDNLFPVEGSSYKITTRDGKDYVELSFRGVPAEGVRQYLKDNYFGWSKNDKVWRANTKHLDVAKRITGEK